MDLSTPRPGRRSKTVAYVHTRGAQIDGLVAARQRRGPQIWDITHLYLEAGGSDVANDLLTSVSDAVIKRRGERIVLRLHGSDPLEDEVRLAGFFSCYRDTLYRYRASRPAVSPGPRPAVRKAGPADDYALFRLYCAAIPQEVRSAFAMTFDQWQASRWGAPARAVEYICEVDGAAQGRVEIARQWRSGRISLMVHPNAGLELSPLLDFGLETLGRRRAAYWVVPEYQVLLQRLLTQRGCEPLAEYSTAVKAVAVARKEEARLPAAALSA